MPDYPQSFDYMMAAWNESDSSKVREQLEKALAPDVRFVDPTIDVTGIDGFEANVHEVHSRIPGCVYSRASAVDSQHGFHRYHWAIHDAAGKLVLPGFDVVETNEVGLVTCVIGFFGELKRVSPEA
ncbi:MAG: nuclear transport factor 2 family protein [Pseudomonadota bacterium]